MLLRMKSLWNNSSEILILMVNVIWRHISLWNIHFNKTRALVEGTKQSRQAWNRLGSPDCPFSLPAWSAHLSCWPAWFCFVPATSAYSSECVFATATNSTNQTNKAGGTWLLVFYFLNIMSMGTILKGGVKTERVFPWLSVLRKNNKMEVLSTEK